MGSISKEAYNTKSKFYRIVVISKCIACSTDLFFHYSFLIRSTSIYMLFQQIFLTNAALFAILQAADLGGLLKLMLRKMSLQLNNPPFNFMIHTTPFQDTYSQLPYAHWFLQIVPQMTVAAGFELGTGCHINPVFPEDAAKILRELCISS